LFNHSVRGQPISAGAAAKPKPWAGMGWLVVVRFVLRTKQPIRSNPASSHPSSHESIMTVVESPIRSRKPPMNPTKTNRIALCCAALLFSAVAVGVPGGEQQTRSRAEFMRMKLEYSKKVLEGLTLEDYAMIAKNAKALKVLSEAAEWEVPTIPNATEYVAFTSDFQRLTDELAKTAKDKNIDGATLVYLRLTMNCVNCHKYVRGAAK
jgi:hypothetical protein